MRTAGSGKRQAGEIHAAEIENWDIRRAVQASERQA
jgi:hypothetical protein